MVTLFLGKQSKQKERKQLNSFSSYSKRGKGINNKFFSIYSDLNDQKYLTYHKKKMSKIYERVKG